ncbi:MAG: hypothetical protein G01um101429_1060 [Parcubacteria group bacterium Gr01-1014_29]|nr:MAG: hypothetical protein G01um101429_1060 [Parcubacteria group bacterium Gr01-1014_29]
MDNRAGIAQFLIVAIIAVVGILVGGYFWIAPGTSEMVPGTSDTSEKKQNKEHVQENEGEQRADTGIERIDEKPDEKEKIVTEEKKEQKEVVEEKKEITAVEKKTAYQDAKPKEIVVQEQTKLKLPQTQLAQQIKSIPTPGYTELVAVSNGVAASLSRDDVLQVVDVASPLSPVNIQTIDTPAFAEAAYQKDGYLYIADSRELRILDSVGKVAGVYNLQNFWPSAISVENGYVYLAAGSEMLILEAKSPQSIKMISKTYLTGQAPSHIMVKDGYAYVIETLGGLNIVDARNPGSPSVVKVFPFESHTAGFGIKGNYAYIGRVSSTKSTAQGYSQTSVFEVVDISNPASAIVISSVEIPTDIRGLDLDGNYAYLIGSFPYRLTPVDISSPANPKIIQAGESIVGSADLQDIVVENGFAFLADGSTGLRIVDVSNITNPRHVKDLDLHGRAFNIHKWGNTLYLAVEQKYFNVADVGNPEDSQQTYSELFTASYKYTSIILDNKKAYFNGSGVRIYDIANVKSPQQIKTKPAEIDSIQIQGNYLYSTIGEIGLLVYDISDPASLVQISRTPFPTGIPRDLSVDGRWAVGISNSPYSINVFDISDPKKPVARDYYIYQKYPGTVTVKDDHAYVARGEDGVDIFKISPDGSLTLIKNIVIQRGYAHHVTIVGNKAFVVRDGADSYDITDQAKPIFLQHINNKGEANRVAVYNGYMYIADGYAGVTIVKMSE